MTTPSHPAGSAASRPYPLAGVRVLDVTVALAGPFCTMILAGLGAEVIKIEAPGGGDIARTNPPFIGPNGLNFGAMKPDEVSVSILLRARNKKSVTLDLKSEEGRRMFMQLVGQSHVIVENLSDGTAERLGVGFEDVRPHNKNIVYASISGLGDPSPYPGLKAMDIIIQALSGVMEVTGFKDGPPTRFGLPVGDLTAPLFAVSGILAALLHQKNGGEGQHVKVNLLGCLSSMLAEEHFDIFLDKGFSPRTGNYHDRLAPFGVYPAKDGSVAIAAPTEAWMRATFEAIERPELKDDPRFASRGPRATNAGALNGAIADWTSRHTAQEVVTELYEKRRVPAARVRGPKEVLNDPRLRESGAIVKLKHPELGEIDAVGPGMPIEFSGCKAGFENAAPSIGQNNEEIYKQLLGLDAKAMAELRARKVI